MKCNKKYINRCQKIIGSAQSEKERDEQRSKRKQEKVGEGERSEGRTAKPGGTVNEKI